MSNITRVLNNGAQIPWIGFGTGTAMYKQPAEDAVTLAINSGFTHIDGAQLYNNEDSMGAAIRKFPRESIWVTTKLGPLAPGETVRDSLQGSLKRMGLDYVDLWLIHTPEQHVGKLKQVWKGCEEVYKEGLARNIGVSNFTVRHLEEILEGATVVPQVNQIEFHPYVLKKSQTLLNFHKKHGIKIESYGGLAPLTQRPDGPLTPVLKSIAEALAKRAGKSVTEAQVLLKWLEKKEIIIVTTSFKESRIKEYLSAVDLPELSDEEVHAIDEAGGKLHYRRFSPYMDD